MGDRTTVLIIESDAAQREKIKDTVKKLDKDFLVIEAKDGNEGLFKINQQCFDLVVLNVNVPKIDGRTILKKTANLTADTIPLKFFLVSESKEQPVLPKKLGDIDLFTTPLDWELFNSKLQTILAAKKEKLSHGKQSAKTSWLDVDVEFINPSIEARMQPQNFVIRFSAWLKQV